VQAITTPIDAVAAMPPKPQRRSKPTWVRCIDSTTLADQGRVIVTFLNGMIQEYRLDDPVFHYMDFRPCRRTAPTWRLHPGDRRAS